MQVKTITINVFNITGNRFCTSEEDGERVYTQIKKAMKSDLKVEISFQNVESLTTHFLDDAIGRLYGDFTESKIKESLSVKGLGIYNTLLLKRVISNAKSFFRRMKYEQKS